MQTRVLVLGAGFGGLELATVLSETLGDDLDLTLVDQADAFYFGFSKLDILFGHAGREAVRMPYADLRKPGVRFVQAAVRAIDPQQRRVSTDQGDFDADHLVIALGAEYDYDATPGLLTEGNEFYSVPGAERVRPLIADFRKGDVVVGVCGAPYKCTPAPSEAALLLHDALVARGVRDACSITFVLPMPAPVPPAPEASKVIAAAFQERGIRFVPGRRVTALDGIQHLCILDDGGELPYDLFLGVPKHRVPPPVSAAGLCGEDGYVAVEKGTFRTGVAGVYAIGDVAAAGVPKAGSFAEGQGRQVAAQILHQVGRGPEPPAYTGTGACYIEFGQGRVGRVDVEALLPPPNGSFLAPSPALAADKRDFGASRRVRWFGR